MPPKKDPLENEDGPSRCACNFSAEQVADALIDKVKDPKTAQEIMDVWGGRIDQQLGRGLRRFGVYVVFMILGVGAIKLNFLEKIFGALK